VGVAHTSHFAAPMGQLYGWLPLSDAPGIVFLQIVPLSDAHGISSVAIQHTKQPLTSVILKNK